VGTQISYGKADIALYRTYARPLSNLASIPESSFSGRPNTLFAANVAVEVFGDNFLPAYTEGDNSQVVATDTMKNFVLKQALAFDGSTLEGLLEFLGRQFLATYPVMQSLRMSASEQPFVAVRVPADDGASFIESSKLFSRSHDDAAVATLDLQRQGDNVAIADHQCGRVGMQLIKLTGSSFASFARDAYTTLPEQIDRPLFIYLDVHWKYADPALLGGGSGYVAAEQVRDLVQVVFHQFVSKSIQHLVHEMGLRLLQRFPQLAEVTFSAQNRLWDTAFVADSDATRKVYCDPRPPYGLIRLTLNRDS
jgi:urate oxidase / 2-oxo-4-hydroxy-4-carboxy-5-ureidoimidazoline decarboxylase